MKDQQIIVDDTKSQLEAGVVNDKLNLEEARVKIIQDFVKTILRHLLDPTIQKILISKNKKNDQFFLSITRHPKIKHRVQRFIKEQVRKQEAQKDEQRADNKVETPKEG